MPRVFHSAHHRHQLSPPVLNDGQHPGTYSHEDFPELPTFSENQNRDHHGEHERRHGHERHAGAEPGVNPRSGESIAEYGHFKEKCVIQVVDYDADDAVFRDFTNASFIETLKNEDGINDQVEEDANLPPRMVRWINIGGIDWTVLSALALRYNIHSLALEDILHERGHTHSKADYYPNHLFIRVLCHTLDGFHDATHKTEFTVRPNGDYRNTTDVSHYVLSSESRLAEAEEGGIVNTPNESSHSMTKTSVDSHRAGGSDQPRKLVPSSLMKRLTGLSGFGGNSRLKKPRKIAMLTEADRVLVNHDPLFIFLSRDGTVISIHPTVDLHHTWPIVQRLHRPDSILRNSEDASLLVESLMDLVVDRVLEVVDEYQVKLDKLEQNILLNPVMSTVRSLHIMSGDLILHKRTLEPIRTMVYGLRRYDLERSRALIDTMALEMNSSDTDSAHDNEEKRKSCASSLSHARRRRRQELFEQEHFPQRYLSDDNSRKDQGDVGTESHHSARDKSSPRQNKLHASLGGHKVEGYFSYKAKVYLADVSDHMDFALTSVDMFAGVSENLINYAFNVASYEMNIVMNRLTLATIIFLPLTLLTGYFGMNFTPFWGVDQHSDIFFWKIAIPVVVVLVPVFMYDDIRKVILYRARKHSMQSGWS